MSFSSLLPFHLIPLCINQKGEEEGTRKFHIEDKTRLNLLFFSYENIRIKMKRKSQGEEEKEEKMMSIIFTGHEKKICSI